MKHLDLIPLCKNLLALNSVSGTNGTKDIVNFLIPIFENLGCRIQTQSLDINGNENLNLLGELGPKKSSAALLINTHLDTVEAGDYQLWTECKGNPFQAIETKGYLFGLGASDTKLAMACVLVALQKVIQKKDPSTWRNTLYVMGSAGEELGLLGARHAMKTNFVDAKFALDSEPSECKIVRAHKGLCVAKIFIGSQLKPLPSPKKIGIRVIQGKAAHSSTPHLGTNAIHQSFQELEQYLRDGEEILSIDGGIASNTIPPHANIYLREGKDSPPNHFQQKTLSKDILQAVVDYFKITQQIQTALSEKNYHDETFNPKINTTNTNLVEVQNNQIILSQDFRFIGITDGDRFFELLKKGIDDLSHKYSTCQFKTDFERHNKPLRVDENSPFIKKLQQILKGNNLSPQLVTKSGCTEAGIFAEHGMECIVIGPGTAENNIHKPNEWVLIENLKHMVGFYERVIETFCF